MRLKVITWPIKDSGWAEADVLNAIEKEEKRSANLLHYIICIDTKYLPAKAGHLIDNL